MRENTFNRRNALKLIGAGGIGSFKFTGLGSGAEERKRVSNNTHTLPYDLKVQNSGSKPVKIIVKFFKNEDRDTPAAKYRSPKLEETGDAEEVDLSINNGYYTVRAKAIFKGGSPITVERELAVPDGGIPDYGGVLVSVFSKEKVNLSEINV